MFSPLWRDASNGLSDLAPTRTLHPSGLGGPLTEAFGGTP
jgi:hypothetical protein